MRLKLKLRDFVIPVVESNVVVRLQVEVVGVNVVGVRENHRLERIANNVVYLLIEVLVNNNAE